MYMGYDLSFSPGYESSVFLPRFFSDSKCNMLALSLPSDHRSWKA